MATMKTKLLTAGVAVGTPVSVALTFLTAHGVHAEAWWSATAFLWTAIAFVATLLTACVLAEDVL